MAEKTYTIKSQGEEILSITITTPAGVVYKDIEWDTRTGLVTAKIGDSDKRVPIPYTGKSYGTVPPGPWTTEGFSNASYNYWYY